jgi:hypothetical protein
MKRISLALIFALLVGIVGQYGPAWAQGTPLKLHAAIRDYEGANFQKAVAALEDFLAQLDLAIEVKVEAMQYLAFSYVGLNGVEKAKGIFTQILDLRPDYQLPAGISPRIQSVFQAALEAWKAAHPPVPPPAKKGGGTPIWGIILAIGLLAGLLGGGGGGGGYSGFDVTIQ